MDSHQCVLDCFSLDVSISFGSHPHGLYLFVSRIFADVLQELFLEYKVFCEFGSVCEDILYNFKHFLTQYVNVG